MQLIPLKNIIIPKNRQRREFDPTALMALTESIQSKGLFHALVIRNTPEGPTLVAGERRLRAIQSLWEIGGSLKFNRLFCSEGVVPTVSLDDLSELEAEEAELEENTVRADLSWQELAEAQKRLHSLRQRQAGELGKVHTIQETALEVRGNAEGWNYDQTRKSLILADHLDKPEVAKAKSVNEAFKILKKAEERTANHALAERVGRTFSSSDHTLIHGDCIKFMAEYSGELFDCILTDPPYGINADKFKSAGGKLLEDQHDYIDDYGNWYQLIVDWAQLTVRMVKQEAHLYAFCDIANYAEFSSILRSFGWNVHRTPIIWHKRQAVRVPWPTQGPRRHYELILYAVRGNKNVNYIAPDVISTDSDENLGMAAQKPVALFEELLARSCVAGNRILDTFGGTGPLLAAAHAQKMFATVIEASPASYAIAYKRLKSLGE